MSTVDWEALKRRVEALGAAVRGEPASGDSERARAVLEERARALAAPPPAPAAEDELALVTFEVGGETYAVETRWVVEVARLERWTPLPGAAPPLFALTAWRGELLALCDLRAMLGMAPAPPGEWMVVLGARGPELALPADRPGSFRAVAAGEVREGGGARGCVRGLLADAVVVLDGAGLLADNA